MSSKGERTRQALLDTALRLFRRHGFDGTTMRDIAAAAGMSLGASYHYFASKEDIVAAYYEHVQGEHERALPAAWGADVPLAERLRVIFRAKLVILKDDRRFLSALFRYVAEPDHPLGVFSARTRGVRERSVALFEAAADGVVAPPLRRVFADAAWLAHLGLLLRFLHDPSKGSSATFALADFVADTAARLAQLASVPAVAALLADPLKAVQAVLEGGSGAKADATLK
jgi:AcrR family transcriptional regulator